MDDVDPPRVVQGAAGAILRALDAFGLRSDAPVLCQSTRHRAYEQALGRLKAKGLAFPCWCSRADLDGCVHRDGGCVSAPRDDRPPAWRLRVPAGDVVFEDALQGRQVQNVREEVGDFVLKRADGPWGYHLACVVDDAHQGMTEIVRGADLLDSTPRQILLQRLLDLPTPAYAHLPLAVTQSGEKLSKSWAAAPVDTSDPERTLARALEFLGQRHEPGHQATPLADAARAFDWTTLRGVRAKCATGASSRVG